jgi:hypothetical protein
MLTMWHADAALGLFVLYHFWKDRFAALNLWADRAEHTFPSWLQYIRWGDPATWVQHACVTAIMAGWGALISGFALRQGFAGGFLHWSVIWASFYVIRELGSFYLYWRANEPGPWWRGGQHRTGWVIDGLMDMAGPCSVAYIALWLA